MQSPEKTEGTATGLLAAVGRLWGRSGERVAPESTCPDPVSSDRQGAPASGTGQESLPAGPSLAPLRQRFLERTREDLAVLEASRGCGQGSESAAIVHRLAGTAGILGYTHISEVAGRLDDALAEGTTNTAGLLHELLVTLRDTLSAGAR